METEQKGTKMLFEYLNDDPDFKCVIHIDVAGDPALEKEYGKDVKRVSLYFHKSGHENDKWVELKS